MIVPRVAMTRHKKVEVNLLKKPCLKDLNRRLNCFLNGLLMLRVKRSIKCM